MSLPDAGLAMMPTKAQELNLTSAHARSPVDKQDLATLPRAKELKGCLRLGQREAVRDSLLHRQPALDQGDHLVKLGRVKVSRPKDGQLPADEVLPWIEGQLVADADDDQRAPLLQGCEALLGDHLAADTVKGDVDTASLGPGRQGFWHIVTIWIQHQFRAEVLGHVKPLSRSDLHLPPGRQTRKRPSAPPGRWDRRPIPPPGRPATGWPA